MSLAQMVVEAADWRSEMAEAWPREHRHVASAERFRALAVSLKSARDPEVVRLVAEIEADVPAIRGRLLFGQEARQTFLGWGFEPTPSDHREFLRWLRNAARDDRERWDEGAEEGGE